MAATTPALAFTICPSTLQDLPAVFVMNYKARRHQPFHIACLPRQCKTDEERIAWTISARVPTDPSKFNSAGSIQAVKTDTGEIIGYARFSVSGLQAKFPSSAESSPATSKDEFVVEGKEFQTPSMTSESSSETNKLSSTPDLGGPTLISTFPQPDPDFMKNLAEGYQKAMTTFFPNDQPRITLENLVVAAGAQRMGVGSMLLKAVGEAAKKEGLGICLIATEDGYGLYLKNGFKVVDELVCTESDGAEHRAPMMFREYVP